MNLSVLEEEKQSHRVREETHGHWGGRMEKDRIKKYVMDVYKLLCLKNDNQ